MARSLNKVLLIGNLGRDPELRTTPSGANVATFTLATNRRWKDKNGEWQDETQWHNLVAWGPQAETIGSYLKKGSRLFVEGRLTHRSWDGQDGQKHYITEIIVENYVFLDAAPEGAKGVAKRETIPPPDYPEEPGSAAEADDIPF